MPPWGGTHGITTKKGIANLTQKISATYTARRANAGCGADNWLVFAALTERREHCRYAGGKASCGGESGKRAFTLGTAGDVHSTRASGSTTLSSAAWDCNPVSAHCIATPVTCAGECRICVNPDACRGMCIPRATNWELNADLNPTQRLLAWEAPDREKVSRPNADNSKPPHSDGMSSPRRWGGTHSTSCEEQASPGLPTHTGDVHSS